jgi:hypothetical protein
VWGHASALTGATTGVQGTVASTSGVAIFGQAGAASGATTGVLARVLSAAGTALVANNTAGGKLFIGEVGSTVKFSVDGSGNVAATTVAASGGTTGVQASGSDTGVSGGGSTGVEGQGGTTGVYGWGPHTGVRGASTGTDAYSLGVFGTGSYGVWGTGTLSGVFGDSTGTGDGVFGHNETSASSGSLGTNYLGGTGVWGTSATYGVYGSAGNTGVYGYGGSYGVYSSGTLGASGSKPAVVALPDNRVVEVYAVESPDVWFEDFGTAELNNGIAEVTLDLTFALTVNTELSYHVFLTPKGDCDVLYVAQQSAHGFQVRESHGGKSNISFDYRIVAKRRGFESVRLQEVDADAEAVAEIREHNHARSGRPLLRVHKKLAPPEVQAQAAAAKAEASAPAFRGLVLPRP